MKDTLFAIYTSDFQDEISASGYCLQYLFTQEGMIASSQYIEIVNQLNIKTKETGLPIFVTLEDLENFTLSLLDHLGARKIHLFSVYDFNALLEGCKSKESFMPALLNSGRLIENNIVEEKKGLFKKIFG